MDVTLKVKRYDPESGEAPHFQEYQVDLPEYGAVLDGLLNVRDEQDGTLVDAVLLPQRDLWLVRDEDQWKVPPRLQDDGRAAQGGRGRRHLH